MFEPGSIRPKRFLGIFLHVSLFRNSEIELGGLLNKALSLFFKDFFAQTERNKVRRAVTMTYFLPTPDRYTTSSSSSCKYINTPTSCDDEWLALTQEDSFAHTTFTESFETSASPRRIDGPDTQLYHSFVRRHVLDLFSQQVLAIISDVFQRFDYTSAFNDF